MFCEKKLNTISITVIVGVNKSHLLNLALKMSVKYIHYIWLISRLLIYQNKQKLKQHRIEVKRQIINAQTSIFTLSLVESCVTRSLSCNEGNPQVPAVFQGHIVIQTVCFFLDLFTVWFSSWSNTYFMLAIIRRSVFALV